MACTLGAGALIFLSKPSQHLSHLKETSRFGNTILEAESRSHQTLKLLAPNLGLLNVQNSEKYISIIHKLHRLWCFVITVILD